MRKFGDDRTAVLNTETEYKSKIREKNSTGNHTPVATCLIIHVYIYHVYSISLSVAYQRAPFQHDKKYIGLL